MPDDDHSLTTDLHVQATYRLTEALVEAENQMRRRVELLTEVVFETDSDGMIVFLNQAWEAAIGQCPAECLGRHLSEFVLPVDRSVYAQTLTDAGSANGSERPLIRLLKKDGGTVCMEISAALIPGGGTVGTLRDVSQRMEVQAELAKLSLVASYTDSLVVITDRHGRTEWVNQAFTKRSGYSIDDLAGRKPGDLLQGPGTNQTTVARIRALLAEGESCEAELINYTSTGEPYWIRLQITPIKNARGEIERFVSIQNDTTELRRTQEALETALRQAESANEAKTLFLATVSHEMRTPLNAVLGYADLARIEDSDSTVLQAYLERIGDNAELLERLISDVLDVSKIEAGQIDMEPAPVEIRRCIDEALGQIGDRAAAKGLTFRFMWDESLPAQVMIDPDRLRQIVTNLAENAVKFTDKGSVRVAVSHLSPSMVDGEMIKIRVVDTGIGISEEAQSTIFERFTQADSSTTRRKGGVGLGLNIVRSLVHALGGTIGMVSSPGHGSEFRVTLPLVRLLPRAAVPDRPGEELLGFARSAAASHASRILVAEDNDPNYAVIEAYLRKAGYVVERAFDGEEAIARARHCDLVLMDVEMPKVDGLEAARRIRDHERERGVSPVPIIAITAHAMLEYRERCLAAGCTGYLAKPFRMLGLLEAVGTALESVAQSSID
ncbi:MAG: PAS domain-containing protein [Actinomycetes bacterium]